MGEPHLKTYWVWLRDDEASTIYVEAEGWTLNSDYNLLQFQIDGRYITCFSLSEILGWGDDK